MTTIDREGRKYENERGEKGKTTMREERGKMTTREQRGKMTMRDEKR